MLLTMDKQEIKKLSVSELHQNLAEQREQLRDLRTRNAERQLPAHRSIRAIRRTIARIRTQQNASKAV